VSEDASGLKWLANSREVTLLSRERKGSVIWVIDVRSGKSRIAARSRRRIASYSINGDGRIVAFAVSLPPDDSERQKKTLTGFPITFSKPVEDWNREDWWTNSSIFLVENGSVSSHQFKRICSHSAEHSGNPCVFSSVNALSISPTGEYLTFNFRPERVPESWKTNLVYAWLSKGGIPVDALAVYNLQSGEIRIGFDGPDAGFEQPAIWSGDGRLFTVVSLAPVGSSLEQEDRNAGFTRAEDMESYTHLFAVDPRTGRSSVVLKSLAAWSQNPTLFWKRSNSPILVRTGKGEFGWMVSGPHGWQQQKAFSPIDTFGLKPSATSSGLTVASDGKVVVGTAESTMTPPEIVKYDIRLRRSAVLSKLNPEYAHIRLGQVQPIEWKSSMGADCSGYLILPSDYVPEKRYPLVIMAKGWTDGFLSDTRFQTAFPPQPLADAGFVVLLANMPTGGSESKERPSAANEGYNWISMIEGGVALLDQRKLIDKANVGIIGFSRTSWNVDFMITHSDFRFAAASSADSGLYNYGTYWYDNSKEAMDADEQAMGGPPYGQTFGDWMQYSPAFNAQRARVPLLMEYCGYGVLPAPVSALEFFVALNRQRKPVELYFYPKGDHILDTPWERRASLQRNVDWFRFWMQNYERPHPEDPYQYVRWKTLRKLSIDEEPKRDIDPSKGVSQAR
jgi:dipeptidyl aminopeptidase/acylaminoacyl peptidase